MGWIRFVRGAALLTIALASCGGGGPTLQEYIASADAICAEAQTKIDALAEPQSLEDVVSLAEQTVVIGQDAMADLRALDGPSERAAEVDALLDKFDRGFTLIRQTGEAAEAGDAQRVQQLSGELQSFTDQTNREAADLGFKDCAEE